MRKTGDFLWLRRGPSLLVVDPELSDAIRPLDLLSPEKLDRAFGMPSGEGAHGRAPTHVLALPHHAIRLHLRRVRHGGWLAGLWGDRLFGIGRPVAELQATHRLRALCVPVPQPALVVAHRIRPFWTAVLATVHEEGSIDGEAFLRAAPARAELIAVARAAGEAIAKLHAVGARHADLHVKNLLVRPVSATERVVIIDFDRARIGQPPSARRRMAELMRLYRSLVKRGLVDRVGLRGCAAFFRAYVAGDRALRHALLASLPREQRRLWRHAMGYRIASQGRAA